MGDYSQFRLQGAPGWIAGPGGVAFHTAMGSVEDYLFSLAQQAVRARFASRSPADGLVQIGLERGMPRATQDTDGSYALRLINAWTTWQFAGTAYGVLRALYDAGYTSAVLCQYQKNYFQLDGNGNLIWGNLGGAGWREDAGSFWSRFTVILPAPLPSGWLAGGTTSVFHGGPGTGTVTVTGTPTSDIRVELLVSTAGAAGGGTAKFKYSLDGGATFSAATTLPNGAFAIPGTAWTATFSGTFTLNDAYSWAPTFNVPADGSSEALRVKGLVNTWKSAMATVSRYVIHTSGWIWGWPITATWGAPGRFWGGSSITTWTP